MTVRDTVLDTALHASLRALKLSGMLETLDARLVQAQAGELGHLDFLQVLCQDEIARRESMSMARRLRRAPTSMSRPPSRDSTSRPARNCPPRRSVTSPPYAGCTAASPFCCTARSASGRPTSRRPSAISPSATAPRSASTRPAVCWPTSPAVTPTAAGPNA